MGSTFVSPGRAIVAGAGITLHRVISMSRTAEDGRLVVVLDGGVPDCAASDRCAGRHTAELIGRVSQAPMRPATVVDGPEGARRCVVSATELPTDIVAGDLVAVAGTGAYHHCRDPFVGRPAVLAVSDGLVRTLVRRETLEDLLLRTS
jgi:diaminopimelate decarboxylase